MKSFLRSDLRGSCKPRFSDFFPSHTLNPFVSKSQFQSSKSTISRVCTLRAVNLKLLGDSDLPQGLKASDQVCGVGH